MISDILQDHFQSPRNVGELPLANADAEDENPICGDRLHIWLEIVDDRIEQMGWRAQGCPPAIAAASMLSEMVRGKSVADARAIDRDELGDALGGVPARKGHALQLAVSCLRKALDGSAGAHNA